MVSTCVLISMSTGTMATNSKEKVRVCGVPTHMHMCMFACVYVCLFTGPIHWLFVHLYVYTYTYVCVCRCVYVCICACIRVHVLCVCMCVCTSMRTLACVSMAYLINTIGVEYQLLKVIHGMVRARVAIHKYNYVFTVVSCSAGSEDLNTE